MSSLKQLTLIEQPKKVSDVKMKMIKNGSLVISTVIHDDQKEVASSIWKQMQLPNRLEKMTSSPLTIDFWPGACQAIEWGLEN